VPRPRPRPKPGPSPTPAAGRRSGILARIARALARGQRNAGSGRAPLRRTPRQQ
jgi:hypothetical protein